MTTSHPLQLQNYNIETLTNNPEKKTKNKTFSTKNAQPLNANESRIRTDSYNRNTTGDFFLTGPLNPVSSNIQRWSTGTETVLSWQEILVVRWALRTEINGLDVAAGENPRNGDFFREDEKGFWEDSVNNSEDEESHCTAIAIEKLLFCSSLRLSLQFWNWSSNEQSWIK